MILYVLTNRASPVVYSPCPSSRRPKLMPPEPIKQSPWVSKAQRLQRLKAGAGSKTHKRGNHPARVSLAALATMADSVLTTPRTILTQVVSLRQEIQTQTQLILPHLTGIVHLGESDVKLGGCHHQNFGLTTQTYNDLESRSSYSWNLGLGQNTSC